MWWEGGGGGWAGSVGGARVIWTAFCSGLAVVVGAWRVPYAGAVDGNYFRRFAQLHPQGRFPNVSLVTLGLVATLFCLFRLQDVIAALVVIRILVQFLMQILGLILLRLRRPDVPRPFRMYLYPAPAFLAAAGFVYVVFMRPNFAKDIRYPLAILFVGFCTYLVRSCRLTQWPFATTLHRATLTYFTT